MSGRGGGPDHPFQRAEWAEEDNDALLMAVYLGITLPTIREKLPGKPSTSAIIGQVGRLVVSVGTGTMKQRARAALVERGFDEEVLAELIGEGGDQA